MHIANCPPAAAVNWAAGADWRNDGDLQLRPDGDRPGNDGDLWHNLPWSGTTCDLQISTLQIPQGHVTDLLLVHSLRVELCPGPSLAGT